MRRRLPSVPRALSFRGFVRSVVPLCGALGWTVSASADPQLSAGWVSGVGGEGDTDSLWRETTWFNALRAELVLGRDRSADLGLGPYLELGTSGFSDVRLGSGVVGVLPLSEAFPLTLGAGATARRDDSRWAPGVSASAMLGSRSYNFHSTYAIATGLVLAYQRDLDAAGASTVIVALQLDGLLLAMPVIFGISAVRGSSE